MRGRLHDAEDAPLEHRRQGIGVARPASALAAKAAGYRAPVQSNVESRRARLSRSIQPTATTCADQFADACRGCRKTAKCAGVLRCLLHGFSARSRPLANIFGVERNPIAAGREPALRARRDCDSDPRADVPPKSPRRSLPIAGYASTARRSSWTPRQRPGFSALARSPAPHESFRLSAQESCRAQRAIKEIAMPRTRRRCRV